MRPESGYRERNSTADRALTILQMFDDERLAISAADVAERLGVARSTAYRYLQTLVTTNFLEEDPVSGFRLGSRVLELARLARRSFDLTGMVLPAMRQLSDQFGQTVLLTKQIGRSVICLEHTEQRGQLVRLSYERGSVLSINAGASALVLLAWLPEEEQRELFSGQNLDKFTDATLTDTDELIERLAEVRRMGVSVTHGEVDPDAMGIAAPIFDAPNHVLAGLSMVLIESRFSLEQQRAATEAVREVAASLTERMRLYTQ